MSDFDKNISDKDIRALLGWQMLELADDPAIQNLIDMEASIVFSNDSIAVPVQKEKEFLNRFGISKTRYNWWKWLLPVGIIAGITIFLLVKNDDNEKPEAPSAITTTATDDPSIENKNEVINESIQPSKQQEIGNTNIVSSKTDSSAHDSVPLLNEMNNGKPLTAGHTKLKLKEEREYPESNIPSLTKKQIEENTKYKLKMLKVNKDHWALIPKQTNVYDGDTVATGAFYMSTTEVTNKQYRTFVHDLLVQGRVDDYIKAVPDTMKWKTELKSEPYTMYYFQHPAYDEFPVVNVSREGAEMYCQWLIESMYEKLKKEIPQAKWGEVFVVDVRLPLDVEWMAAERGGNAKAVYSWEGSEMKNKKGEHLANYWRADDYDPHNIGKDVTAPVRSHFSNGYGSYNMSGNAAEMVLVSVKGKRLRETKPYFDAGTKGGSWNSNEESIKIEAKDEYRGITEGSPYIGFRVIWTYLGTLKQM